MQKQYYKNHLIQKKWGQIFLNDQNIINTIIKIFDPKKHQSIIEIGSGLGALTKPILKIINSLIIIERDPNLINRLIQTLDNKKLKILNQDVMTINFLNLLQQPNTKIRLIGNLPYNISTKLIIYLFKYINIIYDIHFMLQKEVGKCILAQPHHKEYGRLSIITQYHFKAIPLLEIPKKYFFPIPKVDSVMIKLIPYNLHTPYPIVDTNLLSLLTQLAFQQRRKTIRNSLSSIFDTAEMVQHGIDIKLRAENLTITQYCNLAILLYNKRKYISNLI